jgi:hypothetical protein
MKQIQDYLINLMKKTGAKRIFHKDEAFNCDFYIWKENGEIKIKIIHL